MKVEAHSTQSQNNKNVRIWKRRNAGVQMGKVVHKLLAGTNTDREFGT